MKKTPFFNETGENVSAFVPFGVCVQYFFSLVKNETVNKKFILDLIKRNQKIRKRICHVKF